MAQQDSQVQASGASQAALQRDAETAKKDLETHAERMSSEKTHESQKPALDERGSTISSSREIRRKQGNDPKPHSNLNQPSIQKKREKANLSPQLLSW